MARLITSALCLLAGYAAGDIIQIKEDGSPVKTPSKTKISTLVKPQNLHPFVHVNTLTHVAPKDTIQRVVPMAVSSDPGNLSSSVLTHASTETLRLLDLIYEGHSLQAFWKVGHDGSAARELEATKASGVDRKAIRYGEVLPMTFVQLLQHVGAKPGQKYYDLGSGTGKTVVAAWLSGLDATGVELISKRWDTACTTLLKAKHLGFRKQEQGAGLNFVHASFLDLDFSDADVVFTDSSAFSDHMMEVLASVARRMKPGSKIISTLGFPGEGFHADGSVVGPTSESKSTTWTIQTVTSAAKSIPSLPLPSEKVANLIRQEPSVKVANLVRQELVMPSAHPQKKTHVRMENSFMTGSMVHAEHAADDGSKICSLAVGNPTGIAAASATRNFMHQQTVKPPPHTNNKVK